MSFFKGFTQFTKGERRGLVVLFFIMALLIAYIFTSKQFAPESRISDSEYANLESNFRKDPVETIANTQVENSEEKKQIETFDPNNLDQSGWVDLGLSEKQAESVLKYKQRIGSFRSKKDIEKIYVISDKFYRTIEPFIQIKHVSKTVKTIRINSADRKGLIQLPGIGDKLSDRILKYRKSLGGFRMIEQLSEVYGVDLETLETIRPYVIVDSGQISRININDVDPKHLWSHPYVRDWDIVNQISHERDHYGLYESIEDMKQRLNFPESFYTKMQPYLIFQDDANQ